MNINVNIDDIKVRTKQVTTYSLVEQIKKQRLYKWRAEFDSSVIEKVLFRMPLDSIFGIETSGKGAQIVKGAHIISSLYNFYSNLVYLTSDIPELNGKYYKDLPNKLKSRIEDCRLTLFELHKNVPFEAQQYFISQLT